MKGIRIFSLIIILTICLIPLCSLSAFAVAEEGAEEADFSAKVTEWEQWLTAKNAIASTQNEQTYAGHIAEVFASYNLQFGGDGDAYLQSFTTDYIVNTGTGKSQNVIGIKEGTAPLAARKRVIVATAYDYGYSTSLFPMTGTVAEGAHNFSNMYGFFALLDEVSDCTFEFDVVFIAFGAHEAGLLGSNYYFQSLSQLYQDSILLFMNLDSFYGGDGYYLYCRDEATQFENYLFEQLHVADETIQKAPEDKNTTISTSGNYPLVNVALRNDNVTAIKEGLVSCNVVSCNFETGSYSSGADAFTMTEEAKQIVYARARALAQPLKAEDFVAQSQNARDELPTLSPLLNVATISTVSTVIKWVLVAAFVAVGVWLFTLKKRGKYSPAALEEEKKREETSFNEEKSKKDSDVFEGF